MDKLLRFLLYLRRFVLEMAISFAVLTTVCFFYAPDILNFMKQYLGQSLAFYGVFEPMAALIKVSVVTAALILSPWFAFRVSMGLRAVLGFTPVFTSILFASSILLFFIGVIFCFFITLPFGIEFLLKFGSDTLRPVISVGKFVNFSGFFLLGFGTIFQLPLIMVVATRMKLVAPSFFVKYRRYAVLLVAILAAVLTPTPDVFNMALMGIPLYLLFELGIVIARLVGGG